MDRESLTDLSHHVIGIIEESGKAVEAASALRARGLAVTLLSGRSDRERLHRDAAEKGLLGGLIEAMRLLGDQIRIVDRLEEALEQGSVVVVAAFEAEGQAVDAARILTDRDAHDVWRLGEWTQAPAGGDDTV